MHGRGFPNLGGRQRAAKSTISSGILEIWQKLGGEWGLGGARYGPTNLAITRDLDPADQTATRDHGPRPTGHVAPYEGSGASGTTAIGAIPVPRRIGETA